MLLFTQLPFYAYLRWLRVPCAVSATLYARYVGLRNTVFSGNYHLFSGVGSYCSNLFIRQFAVPMSEPEIVSPLNCSVAVVVTNSAKPQMLGVDASRSVAGMHHYLSVRYLSDQQFIGVAMRICSAARRPASSSDDSISPSRSVSSPKPAGRRFLDSRLKGDRGEDELKVIKCAPPALGHIATLAQISAESWRFAKQAFLLNLFHCFSLYGRNMILP